MFTKAEVTAPIPAYEAGERTTLEPGVYDVLDLTQDERGCDIHVEAHGMTFSFDDEHASYDTDEHGNTIEPTVRLS